MTRDAFERELARLEADVAAMGGRAGEAIARAVEALRGRDAALADRVIADDDAIDRLHLELEDRCARLLALQQPMARDLRTIASVFAITIDLERMADHAEGISKATRRLRGQALPAGLARVMDEVVPAMDRLVRQMLEEALAAFTGRDAARAERMAARDDEVDALRSGAFHDLLALMTRDPATVPQALELLLTVQHLERAADHVTNIGERVVYMVTGELRELNV